MDVVRWGMIGCGDVAEVKSGPAFQKANKSALVAVMRRDYGLAADYAHRHSVPRFYSCSQDLIHDPEVDAVYIATPPSSHCELALCVAEAGKPCLVEKPMAVNHAQCLRMVEAFRAASRPLFVAYYRRALPRYLKVRELVQEGAIGQVTSVQIFYSRPLATGEKARVWRLQPSVAGAGMFLDLGSHGIDLVQFLTSPIRSVKGYSVNSGGTYVPEDITVASFQFESGALGTGVWNFNADRENDSIVITGSNGEISMCVFADADVYLRRRGKDEVLFFRNPPHVHQPLVQTIVDQLLGQGNCESTGDTATHTSWVLDQCLANYYTPASDGSRSTEPRLRRSDDVS